MCKIVEIAEASVLYVYIDKLLLCSIDLDVKDDDEEFEDDA